MSGKAPVRVKMKVIAAPKVFAARITVKEYDYIPTKISIFNFLTEKERDRFVKKVNQMKPIVWKEYGGKKNTLTIKCTKSSGQPVEAFRNTRDAFTALNQGTQYRQKQKWN